MARSRRGWGKIQKMRSGRYQATYTGPDKERHKGPQTYDAKNEAEEWLVDERRLIASGKWTPPALRAHEYVDRGQSFGDHAEHWLAKRRTRRNEPLKARTRAHYQSLLDRRILPEFGTTPLRDITPEMVEAWFADMEAKNTPTLTAHAYGLMHAIMKSAATPDGHGHSLIEANPCRLNGAQKADTAKEGQAISRDELIAVIDGMPPHHRLIIALMGWCGLRFGEAIALTRSDLDTKRRKVHVKKAVVRVDRKMLLDSTKNRQVRSVTYPSHLDELVESHLTLYAEEGTNGKLFSSRSGGYLSQSTLNGKSSRIRTIKGRRVNESATGFRKAADAAGVPDIRLHDLRHTAGTLAAATGAGTLRDIMARLGHSSTGAALRYQHAAEARDQEIASRL